MDLFRLAQLELLGEVTLGLMAKGSRTSERFLYAGLRDVEIKDRGLLQGISAHGASVSECVDELWEKTTNLAHGQYLVRSAYGSNRQALRYDPDFGSWVRVAEDVAAMREP